MSQTGEQRSGLQQKASPGKPESLWPAGQAAAHATSMPRRSGSSLGLVIAHSAAVQHPEVSLARRLQQRWCAVTGQCMPAFEPAAAQANSTAGNRRRAPARDHCPLRLLQPSLTTCSPEASTAVGPGQNAECSPGSCRHAVSPPRAAAPCSLRVPTTRRGAGGRMAPGRLRIASTDAARLPQQP